jgi:hypothetical protein
MLVSKCMDYIALTGRMTASEKSERMKKRIHAIFHVTIPTFG